jgi:hypothetical protein
MNVHRDLHHKSKHVKGITVSLLGKEDGALDIRASEDSNSLHHFLCDLPPKPQRNKIHLISRLRGHAGELLGSAEESKPSSICSQNAVAECFTA